MGRHIKTISSFSALALLVGSAEAGTMGPVVANNHATVPFVSLEGSWTAMNIRLIPSHNFQSGLLSVRSDKDSWGGRVAGGVMYSYTDTFKFTAETGWSYFGNKKAHGFNFDQIRNVKLNLDGADLLLGVLYQPSNFGFFVKGGTLFENARYKYSTESFSPLRAGNQNVAATLVSKGKLDHSYVLPEIKVGAVYDLEHWGLSLAYMHAFGRTRPNVNFQQGSAQNNVVNYAVNTNIRGIQVNSVLFGAYYKFA